MDCGKKRSKKRISYKRQKRSNCAYRYLSKRVDDARAPELYTLSSLASPQKRGFHDTIFPQLVQKFPIIAVAMVSPIY